MSNVKKFRVKHIPTGLYWDGNGPYTDRNFNKRGKDFHTLDMAISFVERATKHPKISPQFENWQEDSEVVHLEFIPSELKSFTVEEELDNYKFIRFLQSSVGRWFADEYRKFLRQDISFKYAIRITSNFQELREQLKMLGYNARQYKKTYSLLWTNEDDLIVKLKLLGGILDVYKIDELKKEYYKKVN